MKNLHALRRGHHRRFLTNETEHGHTLVELMVVTVLMTMLTFMVAQVWRPIAASTSSLRDRAVASTEVGLAVEFLRKDFGGASTAKDITETRLFIKREFEVADRMKSLATGDEDPGVEYHLEEGGLMRHDFLLNEKVQIAHDLTTFEVRRAPSGDLNIKLGSGEGKNAHQLTLIWSP